MSRGQNQKTIQWLSVLGSAAFALWTLATLPEAAPIVQRGPAAQKDCDLSALSSGPKTQCELRERKADGSSGDVTATINIEIRPDKAKKTLYGAKPADTNEKPVDMVEVEVTAAAYCAECRENVQSTTSLRTEASRFRDLDELASWVKREVIDREARRAMEEVKQQVKNEKVRAENEEKCLTRNGENLLGKERLTCRIGKLAALDEEKGADYFHRYLKDDLQAMLQSDNPVDRSQAMQLLNKLDSETSNMYIKTSARDLVAFGQYNLKQAELLNQVTSLPPNDPRRSMLLQQLGTIKQQWGNYFQMRGYQTNNLANMMTDSLVYSLMSQDIGEYQRRLDANYSSIVNQTRVQMNGANVAPGFDNGTFTAAGQGRLSRGMVNGYNGAPGNGFAGPNQGFSNNGFATGQQPFPQQPFPQQQMGMPPQQMGPGQFNRPFSTGPQGLNRGVGYGKPQLGAPVGR